MLTLRRLGAFEVLGYRHTGRLFELAPHWQPISFHDDNQSSSQISHIPYQETTIWLPWTYYLVLNRDADLATPVGPNAVAVYFAPRIARSINDMVILPFPNINPNYGWMCYPKITPAANIAETIEDIWSSGFNADRAIDRKLSEFMGQSIPSVSSLIHAWHSFTPSQIRQLHWDVLPTTAQILKVPEGSFRG